MAVAGTSPAEFVLKPRAGFVYPLPDASEHNRYAAGSCEARHVTMKTLLTVLVLLLMPFTP